MKTRHGFVTNSSSSSYILSSDSGFETVEEVYQYIRSIYMNIPNDVNEAFKRLFKLKLIEPGGEYFRKIQNSGNKKKIEAILNEYGLDSYTISELTTYEIPQWCKCETYEDYIRFINGSIGSYSVPRTFVIVDLRKMPVDGIDDPTHLNDLADWYEYEALDKLDGSTVVCESCEKCEFNNECSKKNPSACRIDNQSWYEQSEYKIHNVLKITSIMGSIAVYDPDECMEGFISNRLRKLSSRYCDHMG